MYLYLWNFQTTPTWKIDQNNIYIFYIKLIQIKLSVDKGCAQWGEYLPPVFIQFKVVYYLTIAGNCGLLGWSGARFSEIQDKLLVKYYIKLMTGYIYFPINNFFNLSKKVFNNGFFGKLYVYVSDCIEFNYMHFFSEKICETLDKCPTLYFRRHCLWSTRKNHGYKMF